MTKLSMKVKHDTLLETVYGLRFEPESPNETVREGEKSHVNNHEDNYHENEVIEVPVFRKMLFQFNKPVKLEFS